MSNPHFFHAVGHSFKHADSMAPVRGNKNPAMAFMMGFLFGPIGVGLYLQSPKDFLITLAMVVVGAVMTMGIGAPFFWALCGCWAAARVSKSRKAHQALPHAAQPISEMKH